MRVLDLTVPTQPLLSILGAHQRAEDSLEGGRAWCMAWLPVLRARAGLTQNQLADSLRISRQTYRMIELGECVPSRETAERLLTWLADQRGD